MSQYRSLDQVRIARPCPARWEDMAGDEKVRFCGLCSKNVYNLSAMSREAATKLIAEREGNLCALLYRRRDGTVLTSDCSVGVRAFTRRVFRRVAAAAASLLMIAGGRFLTPEIQERPMRDSRKPEHPSLATSRHLELSPEQEAQLRSLGYVVSSDEHPD